MDQKIEVKSLLDQLHEVQALASPAVVEDKKLKKEEVEDKKE